ncbi:GNAT family N-acetyltransferase [Arsenicicoccus sp. oral taxon 190]|uniref:GNAT family N-acetyltransferase n=1 Tax=Arsenicicoccus sp. oral taxon 190 TaxID=1658671 RepID=UPI000679F324|nr:GNAT family N-acetyltransferase [Arsenicicoccus sp. oral taxon 190]AKT50118.1 GCN5 family acetyltransferase [Arsenicicoccus sp. oral taxon 190]
MPQLVAPTTRLHRSWLASLAEWGVDEHGERVHQHGASLRPEDDAVDAAGFAAWVQRLRREADPAAERPRGHVPATNLWVTEGSDYLGAISLRHALSPALVEVGGHVGYGIRPSARGRGLATWALGQVLPRARGLGLERVLLTCDDTNPASAAVIERNGGVLEDVREHAPGARVRRYWITVST